MTARRLLAGTLGALLMLAAAPASADNTDEARSHFTRGVELFREGDFRAALIEFQRAYDAAPNFKVLYNLAQTSLELQDYASALRAFREYLDGGGALVPPARRAQVEGELRKLESRVARIDVVVSVEGADVSVDDVLVGRSPLHDPVLVGAGRRKVVVYKPGLLPITRMVDVAGGDRARVTIELVEPKPQQVIVEQPPPPEPVKPTPPPPPPPPVTHTVSSPSTAFYVALVTTGAFAASTGVLGAFALSSKSTFDAKVSTPGVSTSDVDGARDQTRTFAALTDVAGGVAVVAAITTVVLAVTTSNKRVVVDRASFVPTGLGVAGIW